MNTIERLQRIEHDLRNTGQVVSPYVDGAHVRELAAICDQIMVLRSDLMRAAERERRWAECGSCLSSTCSGGSGKAIW